MLLFPDLATSGSPVRYVTWLSIPETPIFTVVSTVTAFSTPETVRVSQLPSISTVLETPLTLTEQPSQLIATFL